MIPKEIQDKISEKYPLQKWMDNEMWNENKRQKTAAEYGYQLATDGREELEKEISILHGFRDYLLEDQKVKHDQITALQSQKEELEKENEQLREHFLKIKIDMEERQIEQLEQKDILLDACKSANKIAFDDQLFNLSEIRRKEINKLILELGEKEKECAALKTQNSAMKVHFEAGKKITEHSLQKANEAKSAVETVDSEREMNAILTKELEELKAENERLKKILDIVNDRPDL